MSSVKPRILVIERDVALQRRIALQLEREFTIDLTSSGALALLLMKDYRYACILASYMLPNRHEGSGILHAIRNMPGGRYVPVVATGSDSNLPDRERVITEGFVDQLRMPSELDRLVPVLEDVLVAWD